MPAALVTGASRGIGAAVARRLARDGYDVAVHYRDDRDGAEATAHDVRGQGRRVAMVPGDLLDFGTPEGIVQDAASALGPLDILVLNAGMYDRRKVADTDQESWRRTIAVHLDAPAAMVRAALPHFTRQARIVFVSSVAAHRGSRHGAHYAAAKAGVEGLARSLAREMAPIRVNCVAPGYIATGILAGDEQEDRRRREAEVPLGRIGTPEDVAAVVSFLGSADAGYMTGQVLHVNGGLWMG